MDTWEEVQLEIKPLKSDNRHIVYSISAPHIWFFIHFRRFYDKGTTMVFFFGILADLPTYGCSNLKKTLSQSKPKKKP